MVASDSLQSARLTSQRRGLAPGLPTRLASSVSAHTPAASRLRVRGLEARLAIAQADFTGSAGAPAHAGVSIPISSNEHVLRLTVVTITASFMAVLTARYKLLTDDTKYGYREGTFGLRGALRWGARDSSSETEFLSPAEDRRQGTRWALTISGRCHGSPPKSVRRSCQPLKRSNPISKRR